MLIRTLSIEVYTYNLGHPIHVILSSPQTSLYPFDSYVALSAFEYKEPYITKFKYLIFECKCVQNLQYYCNIQIFPICQKLSTGANFMQLQFPVDSQSLNTANILLEESLQESKILIMSSLLFGLKTRYANNILFYILLNTFFYPW